MGCGLVQGQGLELVRVFYSLLPQRQKWHERVPEAVSFLVDEVFSVPGVGTVVAGTLKVPLRRYSSHAGRSAQGRSLLGSGMPIWCVVRWAFRSSSRWYLLDSQVSCPSGEQTTRVLPGSCLPQMLLCGCVMGRSAACWVWQPLNASQPPRTRSCSFS